MPLLLKRFSEVSKATNEARSTLSSVGLPGSLEAYKSGGTLPANLWAKIERIQTLGGVVELQRKLRNVNASGKPIVSQCYLLYGPSAPARYRAGEKEKNKGG